MSVFAMDGNFLQRETLLIQSAFGAQFRKLSDLWLVQKLIDFNNQLSPIEFEKRYSMSLQGGLENPGRFSMPHEQTLEWSHLREAAFRELTSLSIQQKPDEVGCQGTRVFLDDR
ncbi:hypothetical protein [Pseudomonas extremaustralis]|uniref:hypothetical protein n=1 Tax=Pseudomonas extremaustralis TaxID=359110 RepID=UPI00123B0377|nr:hypothetical protein [Pseudomonas extremaustralis]